MSLPQRDRGFVAFCVLGASRDRAMSMLSAGRWRPILDLCAGRRPRIDRLELIVPPGCEAVTELLQRQLRHVAPQTAVRLHALEALSARRLEEAYEALRDFAARYPFRSDAEEYLLHLTTGTAVQQIAMVMVWAERRWPARLAFAPRNDRDEPSGLMVLDLPDGAWRVTDSSRAAAGEEPASLSPEASPGSPALIAPARDPTVGVAETPAPPAAPYSLEAGLCASFEALAQALRATGGPVAVCGPPGCGKSHAAQRLATRIAAWLPAAVPVVRCSCRGLPPGQAGHRLWGDPPPPGHSGAADPGGCWQAAAGGVLILDDVDELDPATQAVLYDRLSDRDAVAARAGTMDAGDPRFIIATFRADYEGGDRDPERLRPDLEDWLAGLMLALPPITQRPRDIRAWLSARAQAAEAKGDPRAADDALASIRDGSLTLPAGFRDLENLWRRRVWGAPGGNAPRPPGARQEKAPPRTSGTADPAHPSAGVPLLEALLGPDAAAALDRFDRVQLADVLAVCAEAPSLSEAGRALFAASRARKKTPNDADRLRKYLNRFGISFADVQGRATDLPRT